MGPHRLNVLDLFSGIGGFSLGLMWAGMEPVAFCEIEPFCREVLGYHWPLVPCYEDVRSLTGERLAADGITADVICGGFPCQDISVAGKGAGLDGARSGLWREYARIIGEVRPRWVIIENVPALRSRGLDQVLGALAALGYDAEWHCIPACALGAPHRRDRIWIVAHAQRVQGVQRFDADVQRRRSEQAEQTGMGCCREDVAHAQSNGRDARGPRDATERQGGRQLGGGCVDADVAHTELCGRQGWHTKWLGPGAVVPSGWWGTEPDVGRVAYGVPSRVDRLRALGNSIVPQIAEIIGRAILKV